MKRVVIAMCVVGVVVAIFMQSGPLAAEEVPIQHSATLSPTVTRTPSATPKPPTPSPATWTPNPTSSFPVSATPVRTTTPISEFRPPTRVYNPEATPTTLPPDYHTAGYPLQNAPIPDGITLYNELHLDRIEMRYTDDCIPNTYEGRIFIRNYSPSFVGTFLISIEYADSTLVDHYISQMSPYGRESVTIPLTIINDQMPTILIDRTNLINEIDETNNRIENPPFTPPLISCGAPTDTPTPTMTPSSLIDNCPNGSVYDLAVSSLSAQVGDEIEIGHSFSGYGGGWQIAANGEIIAESEDVNPAVGYTTSMLEYVSPNVYRIIAPGEIVLQLSGYGEVPFYDYNEAADNCSQGWRYSAISSAPVVINPQGGAIDVPTSLTVQNQHTVSQKQSWLFLMPTALAVTIFSMKKA